jgi:hypothetical protein
LLIVTLLGRYLLSTVGWLTICRFFLGTLSESLAGGDAPTESGNDVVDIDHSKVVSPDSNWVGADD